MESDLLPAPVERLASIAATEVVSPEYKPNLQDRALAGALITGGAHTFVELAHKAGISLATLYRIMEDPKRCSAIVAHAGQCSKAGLAAVYSRILQEALVNPKVAWARLFLERFDDEFKSKSGISAGTVNIQQNIYKDMSNEELKAFVQQMQRKAGL